MLYYDEKNMSTLSKLNDKDDDTIYKQNLSLLGIDMLNQIYRA